MDLIDHEIQKPFLKEFVWGLVKFSSKLTGLERFLAAWVMPQGWDLGVPWGVRVVKNIFQHSTRFGV